MIQRWRLLLLTIVLFISIAGLVFTTTPYGVVYLFMLGVQQKTQFEDISFENYRRTSEESTLISDFTLKGLNEDDEASVKVQRVLIQDISPFGVNVSIEQGRFFSSDIPDPIFFEGSIIENNVNAYGYARDISLQTFWKMFNIDGLHLRGNAADIEFNIAGTLDNLILTGNCRLTKFSSLSFDAVDTDVNLRLFFDRRGDSFIPRGEIILKNGIAKARGREFKLTEAQILLNGDGKPPKLNILAQKIVGNVTIFLNISGNKDHMNIRLTSAPYWPEDQLWEMLALGPGATPTDTDGRLEGKVPISKSFSVNVDRKVEQDKGVGVIETDTPQPPEDRIMLEFKSQF